LIST
jgi:hypothetical protein